MEFEISLQDLHFYSYHGVLDEERTTGNEFKVNLSVWIPAKEDIKEDNLQATVSYVDLFEIVKSEMSKSRKLLETVCFSISQRIKDKFPEVLRGYVKIEKKRPPIKEMLGYASVSLNF